MPLIDADRMASSADTDQTAPMSPSGLAKPSSAEPEGVCFTNPKGGGYNDCCIGKDHSKYMGYHSHVSLHSCNINFAFF